MEILKSNNISQIVITDLTNFSGYINYTTRNDWLELNSSNLYRRIRSNLSESELKIALASYVGEFIPYVKSPGQVIIFIALTAQSCECYLVDFTNKSIRKIVPEDHLVANRKQIAEIYLRNGHSYDELKFTRGIFPVNLHTNLDFISDVMTHWLKYSIVKNKAINKSDVNFGAKVNNTGSIFTDIMKATLNSHLLVGSYKYYVGIRNAVYMPHDLIIYLANCMGIDNIIVNPLKSYQKKLTQKIIIQEDEFECLAGHKSIIDYVKNKYNLQITSLKDFFEVDHAWEILYWALKQM